MDSTPSSVHQVFAITELLEQILIALAELAIQQNHFFNKRLEPMQSLSAVQRVSHKFRQTTLDSSRLQEMMHQMPSTLSCPIAPAIYWLMYIQLKISVSEKPVVGYWHPMGTQRGWLNLTVPGTGAEEPKTLQIFGLRMKHREDTKLKLATFRDKEASWRRDRVRTRGEELAKICVAEIEFPVGEFVTVYDEDLDVNGEATLGEVFDRYCKIAERTSNGHFVAAEKSGTFRRRRREW